MTTENDKPSSSATVLTPYQSRSLELREEIDNDSTPRAIVPRSLAQAKAFADMIASSSLIPDALKNRAPDIAVIVLAGAEIGIPPMKSLGLYHVMEGVPKLSSLGLGAVVTASPLCEYLEPVEQSNTRVTWRGKRRGRPEVQLSYSDEDVKLAGLDRPTRSGAASNHAKFPRDMKNARCRAALANLLWPDIAGGIQTAEEAQDIRHLRALEADATPTAPPAPIIAKVDAPKAAPAPAPAPKADKAKSAPKAPIDVPSSETKSATGAPPPPTEANTTTTTSPLPPDTARDAALAKAGEAARELEQSRVENGGNTMPAPEAAPASESDGFGDDEAMPDVVVRTLAAFEAAVRAAVESKSPDILKATKAEWIPWSKEEGPNGGKIHAGKMRDIFTKAAADLGVR